MPGSTANGTYAHDLGRRHPFEVAMLCAAVVVGFSRALAPTSGAIQRGLPLPVTVSWYSLLAVGGIICLVGIYWREKVTGLIVERAGLCLLTAGALAYSIVLVTVGGWSGVAAGAFILAFGIAAALRSIDIGRILRRVRLLRSAQEVLLDEGGGERRSPA